jgi:hypothetical protein
MAVPLAKVALVAVPAPAPAASPKAITLATRETTGEIEVDDILTEPNAKLEVKTPHSKRQPAKTEPMKLPVAVSHASSLQPVPRQPPPPTVPTRPAVVAREDLDEERVAGLPRKVSPQAKRVVVIVVALAVILSVVGGLQALRARQDRQIEAMNARDLAKTAKTAEPVVPPPTVTANATEIPSGAPAPVASEPAASASAAPVETATAALTAPAPPPPAPTDTAAAATATAAPEATATPPVATHVATALPVPTAPVAAVPAHEAAPAHETAPAHEAPVDTGLVPGGGSPLSQASKALAKGDTARAVSLARQAVSGNPSNADAWLTLGAALQASGNAGAARDAYKSCVTQAHSANVNECRMLAGP